MPSKVGNYERSYLNMGYDFIVNSIKVLNTVYTYWFVSSM